jgi:hypothetical protein
MRRRTRSRRSALLGSLVLGLTLAAATAVPPAASESQAFSSRLGFQVRLYQSSGPFTWPCPGVPLPEEIACIARTATGFVRGLGNVSVTYTWLLGVGPPACPADSIKPLATTAFLSVARKGHINFMVAEGARCVPVGSVPAEFLFEPQEFTITGGTGRFAGASGRGKRVQRSIFPDVQTETWTGTLEVPGLEFDVWAPKLHGASSKIVRAQNGAKSARVTFKVTATDNVDGAVPVSCRPRSGSRFKMGRTTVRCEATDSSGNTGNGAFTITVKRRR